MNALRWLAVVTFVTWMVHDPARAAEPSPEQLVPSDRIAQAVEVRDVAAQDGTVSGVLVNRSGRRLKDVRLRINHLWLWNDERRPGEDRFSRSDYFTVSGELPPGGTLPFTYRGAPLGGGPGGRFTTVVEPAGFVEFVEGAGAAAPPADAARPPGGEPSAPAGERVPVAPTY